ncbi:hypothetical protein GBA52_011662 [Prunus armeniaca]|nr:hypothetical protein GBA52_011662 [Prunus armeniaca]
MKVKQDLLASSEFDVYSLVPPSPYDTAWLSMVPNPQQSDQPLFQGCLDWVLQQQTRGGLAFIHGNTEKLLEEQNGSFSDWFAIVFPAMIELAETKGLHVYFSNGLVEQVFLKRQEILQKRRWVSGCGQQQNYPALMLKYLEDGSYISCEEPKRMAKNAMPIQLFLGDEDIVAYIEEYHELFLSAINEASDLRPDQVGTPD